MADARRLAAAAGLAAAIGLPLALALTDVHLSAGPAALVVSTATGALAVSVIALQPVFAASARVRDPARARRRLRRHRLLGAAALALVLAHVGALFAVEVDDTLFAMSPDGPTRARMALMALIALVAAVLLGASRGRLPMAGVTWRILHAYLAVLVIVLGIGHAVLTDGALDGAGTIALVVLGLLGLAGVAAAHALRPRRQGESIRPPVD